MKDIFRKIFFVTIVLVALMFGKTEVFASDTYDAGNGITLLYSISDEGVKIQKCFTTQSGDIEIPAEIEGKQVIEIEYEAFKGCYDLTGALVIPEGVKRIEDRAFQNCGNLTSLVIPETVTYIGESAFENCSGLRGDLTIPEGVTEIKNKTFRFCGFTGELTIPDSVTKIGNEAFCICRKLTGSLTIPEGVTSIGNSAFKECESLTGNLTISNTVTSIGSKAFEKCGFTGNLNIPDSVTSIGSYAFFSCDGFTGNLTIPYGVTTIGEFTFYWCRGLGGSLTIPDSVTSIGHDAFRGCSGLTGNLTIPDGVTSISYGAFEGCANLTGDLTIPDSVSEIGYRAFADCYHLDGTLTIPDSITEINMAVFSFCSFRKIIIPNSVTRIGNAAFKYCVDLTGSLTIPDSVTSIGDEAFYNCRGLTGSLTIPDSVTEIGKDVIAYTDISEIKVDEDNLIFLSKINGTECNGVFSESENAIRLHVGCKATIIPNSVSVIGPSAFKGCLNLSGNLVIPSGVTEICDEAFLGCYKLECIDFPSTVITFGEKILSDRYTDSPSLRKVINSSKEKIRIHYGNGTSLWRLEGGDKDEPITWLCNGTAVRGLYEDDNEDESGTGSGTDLGREEDSNDDSMDISNPYSAVHDTDGGNVVAGSVSSKNAKWMFNADKSNTVIVVKSIDLSNKLKSFENASGYEVSAKHRYKTDKKSIAKINKKGILIPKKSGEINISLEQKVKGGRWVVIGNPVHLYIQKPVMEKK